MALGKDALRRRAYQAPPFGAHRPVRITSDGVRFCDAGWQQGAELAKNGSPVVPAVHPDAPFKRIRVNLLASAYPKERADRLTTWQRDGLLRNFGKEKAREWATNVGIQFPWLVQLNRGLPKSVIGPSQIVDQQSRAEPMSPNRPRPSPSRTRRKPCWLRKSRMPMPFRTTMAAGAQGRALHRAGEARCPRTSRPT